MAASLRLKGGILPAAQRWWTAIPSFLERQRPLSGTAFPLPAARPGPVRSPAQELPDGRRHLNFFTVFSKESWARERERLRHELNRGYFDDFKELKQTGGKLAASSSKLLPVAAAVPFPPIEVWSAGGQVMELPSQLRAQQAPKGEGDVSDRPMASLICVTFRASGQVWLYQPRSEQKPSFGRQPVSARLQTEGADD